MSLVALIVAAREASGLPPTLAALLPIAGRTLLEQQARRAAHAGADELILVADRLPPEIMTPLERLRDGGMVVHLARGAGEAVGLVSRASDLLLIADGVLPSAAALASMVAAEAPALLVLRDQPGMDDLERIDRDTRWGGLARLRHGDLVSTIAMLGEWDLELTLVRNLVAQAARVESPAAMDWLVQDRVTAAAASAALADESAASAMLPVERGLLGWVMERPVEAGWLRTGGAGAAAGGALLAGGGPLWLAAPLLLMAGPLDRLGRRLAVVRQEKEALGSGWVKARLAALGAALPLFGWRLSGATGFEPLLLALAALAFLIAARAESRLHDLMVEQWSARPEPMLLIATGFAVAGQGVAGLAALAAWTTASFFRLQWRAGRHP